MVTHECWGYVEEDWAGFSAEIMFECKLFDK